MPTTLVAGPFRGVMDVNDPYEVGASLGISTAGQYEAKSAFLRDAVNLYCPDLQNGAAFYARPGLTQVAQYHRLYPGPPASQQFHMTTTAGTEYDFWALGGKLYRVSGPSFSTATDVTPVGVTISNSSTPTTRYYMNQLADQLIFTDGVNRPWLGTDLASTPITGASIDLDGGGSAWTAQGPPVLYGGAVLFLVKTYTGTGAVKPGVGFTWCEPNQPTTGYVQSGYTDFFNYIQTGVSPLTGGWGTNEGFYLWRETSVNLLTGALNSLSSSTTGATLAYNVGTLAPATISQFGRNIFFVDRVGRPYMMPIGGAPIPIYTQLRGQIDANAAYVNYPVVSTAYVGIGCIHPTLNLYIVAPWSPTPSASPPGTPTTAFVFDALTGVYLGRWQYTGFSELSQVTDSGRFNSMGMMKDDSGNPVFTIGAWANPSGTEQEFNLWQQTPPSTLTWTDVNSRGDLTVPTIQAKTHRLGNQAGFVNNLGDVGGAIVMSSAVCTVTVDTPYGTAQSVTASATPSPSSDKTYSLHFGMDVMAARDVQVTISPNTSSAQWGIMRVEIPATLVKSTVDDV